MADLQHIEKAIRDALAKVDAGDPKIRQRIYGTVWKAHERSLAASEALDDTEKVRRRDALKALIGNVESEFRPARPSEPAAPKVTPENRVEPGFSPSSPPRPAEAHGAASGLEGVSAGVDRQSAAGKPAARNEEASISVSGEDRAQAPRRRSFAMFFAVATLLVAVGIGIIWTFYTGILVPRSERDVPVPPAQLDAESYPADNGQAKKEQPAETKWITVFDPADPTQMSVSGAAAADITKNGDEQFARITSSAPDGEVRFDVGQGVLDELAGSHAVFDLTLRAEGDKPTQVAVRCDFSGLAVCDRKRYEVGITRQEYLLEVNLPAGIRAGAGGTIAINTDIAGTGSSVDVYSIRVRPAK